MLQIGSTLISLDILEKFFICDLSDCLGECCIEGDAGAPLEEHERLKIKEILPEIWDGLLPAAQEIIKAQGIAYIDEEGDTVTSIVHGKDCVFTYYEKNGLCKCAIEKAYLEGRVDFHKPISCHLYPIRVKKYKNYSAVNYHKWKICKAAELLGKKENIRVYEFLKEPLIRKFGEDWYNELEMVAQLYLKEKDAGLR